VVAQVEAYLTAKQQEFQAKLEELIGGARGRIAALWTEMRAGAKQQSDMFPPYFTQGTCL